MAYILLFYSDMPLLAKLTRKRKGRFNFTLVGSYENCKMLVAIVKRYGPLQKRLSFVISVAYAMYFDGDSYNERKGKMMNQKQKS